MEVTLEENGLFGNVMEMIRSYFKQKSGQHEKQSSLMASNMDGMHIT